MTTKFLILTSEYICYEWNRLGEYYSPIIQAMKFTEVIKTMEVGIASRVSTFKCLPCYIYTFPSSMKVIFSMHSYLRVYTLLASLEEHLYIYIHIYTYIHVHVYT